MLALSKAAASVWPVKSTAWPPIASKTVAALYERRQSRNFENLGLRPGRSHTLRHRHDNIEIADIRLFDGQVEDGHAVPFLNDVAREVAVYLVIGCVIVVILLIREFGDGAAQPSFDSFGLIFGVQRCLRYCALYARNREGNDRLASFHGGPCV